MEAVHQAIKDVWENSLKRDHSKHWLRREDSLKAAFYFHLRNALGDNFFEENRIRLYTEYFQYVYRVDLAVVQVDEAGKPVQTGPIALVEFKFKGASCSYDIVTGDIHKFNVLRKDPAFSSTRFYLAILHEEHYHRDEPSWLDGRQRRWANKHVTELSGFLDESTGELVMTVVP